MTVQSVFHNATDEWPFQDHLWNRTLPSHKTLSHETSIVAIQSLPSVTVEWPAISLHLPSKTMNLKISGSQYTRSVTVQDLSPVSW